VSDGERRLRASQLAQGVQAEQRERRAAAAEKAWKTCVKQLARLTAAVRETEDALDEGGVYLDEYSADVAAIVREFDRLDIAALSDPCLAVAAPLEQAASLYQAAVEPWSACDLSYSCDFNARAEPLLQKGWRLADGERVQADAALRRMRTTPPAGTPKVGGFATSVPQDAGDVERSVYGQAVFVYCGSSMDVAASEACSSLRAILSGGVNSDELDELDGATQGLIEAHNLAPESES